MRKSLVLGFTIALAFFLRIWQIDKFPAGFTADEAAQGYTAYSILQTGKDEWGAKLPLAPRSFGDFKPPLYTYLTIPSVAIFGLTEFAVRFPSAVFGTLAVFLVYLLARELFPKEKFSIFNFQFSIGEIAALMLAISPWHISLSRGAFEANLTTFFLPLGFYLFLKGLKNGKFLILSALVLGLNLFTYHSARLLTPVFLGFLIWWKRKDLFSGAAALVFVLFLGIAAIGVFGGSGTRVFDIGIFSAGLEAPRLFIGSFLSYFSPEFFFTHGAGEATYGMIPGRGVLYLIELPFLIFALLSLAKKWNNKFFPILVWIVLAPVPAALAQGVGYHANRVAIMMPAIQILSAYGLIVFSNSISKWKKIIYLVVGLVIFISFSFFLWDYFYRASRISAPAMSYGWKEAMNYVSGIENGYQKVVISRRFSEPQAFVAFYKKWNPEDFQKESTKWLRYQEEGFKFVDQLGKYNLGKYEFRQINWLEDKNLKDTLFVGKETDFPQNESLRKRIIPYPDGERALLIVERL
ncbi:MAG: glycosyltransferase family 39 protein [Patescibacteria group bacterium]